MAKIYGLHYACIYYPVFGTSDGCAHMGSTYLQGLRSLLHHGPRVWSLVDV